MLNRSVWIVSPLPCKSPRRSILLGAIFATAILALPAQAPAAPLPAEAVRNALVAAGPRDGEIAAFYASRQHRPLWLAGNGLRPEAQRVVDLAAGAAADGLNPADYGAAELAAAVADARRGSAGALARAEILLSRALAAYVGDLRGSGAAGMAYVDPALAPRPASIRSVLIGAANTTRLGEYIDELVRMNPVYAQLRQAAARQIARSGSLSPSEAALIRVNLDRARALPADPGRRFILVDAASARLWLYEDGAVRDTMRVVVGKQTEQTPLMAGMIRNVTLNPYWNVPPDLVQRRIAPNVLSQGLTYLRTAGYQVLSDWSEDARVIDPATIDWAAVAAGRRELAVRQLPGPRNAMGRMKFMFPNTQGIYLHDTPDKARFEQADRRQSSVCVRGEDADRLAACLCGRDPGNGSDRPEQSVALGEPVPVYITYMTAAPERGRIAFRLDVYGRDRALVAQLGGGSASGAP